MAKSIEKLGRWIALVGVFLFAMATLFVVTGVPRTIQVSSSRTPVDELEVTLLGRNEGRDSTGTTNAEGEVSFGRGFWAWPGHDDKLLVMVRSDTGIEWQGLVVCPWSTTVTISIDEDDVGKSSDDQGTALKP